MESRYGEGQAGEALRGRARLLTHAGDISALAATCHPAQTNPPNPPPVPALQLMGNFNSWEWSNMVWAFSRMSWSPGEAWLGQFVFWWVGGCGWGGGDKGGR